MNTLFRKDYDIVVCGGGVAGVAAALAAARQGQKTALIEKTVYPGGLATTGMVFIYLPLCDGNGTQVTSGIAEELLLASMKYGPGRIPNWQRGQNAAEAERYRIIFSPASFMLGMDELLTDAGVDVWFDTLVCATRVESGRLTGIEVENKSGRGLISGKCFVDATGDADLAHFSGLSCGMSRNALACWTLEHGSADGNGCNMPDADPSVYMRIVGTNIDAPAFDAGIDGSKVSRFILDGRRRYREILQRKYAEGQRRQDLYPVMLPAMAEFRMTRAIPGHYVLTDNEDWTSFEDSIGLAADWRKSGYVWEIPYRTLLPRGLQNLVAAGRCIGAQKDAWEVTRVIPVAAMTGEAAGVAAALAASAGCSPEELDVALVQQALRKNGNKMHFDEVGLQAKK